MVLAQPLPDAVLFFSDTVRYPVNVSEVDSHSQIYWAEEGDPCELFAYIQPTAFLTDIVSIGNLLFGYAFYSDWTGVNAFSQVYTVGTGPPFWTYLVSSRKFVSDTIYQGVTRAETNGYHVYLAGDHLARILADGPMDLEGTIEFLGNFPPEMACQGDLTYREGKLYMSTVSHQLIEVNVDDPASSTVVMDFPDWAQPIHGLATVKTSCALTTYAIGRVPYENSKLYEIDFENMTLIELCELPGEFLGLDSPSERSYQPFCAAEVNMDVDGSSGAEYPADANMGLACTPPVYFTEDDVECFSPLGFIDSIRVYITYYTIFDDGFESLSLTSSLPEVQILNNNTDKVTLVNNMGMAELEDFATVLSSLVYYNTASPLTYGERKISILPYVNGFSGASSIVHLNLTNQALEPEVQINLPVCAGEENGSILLTPQGGVPPYEIEWDMGGSGTLIENLSAGSYICTITDSMSCSLADTFFVENPDTLLSGISNFGLPHVCDSLGVLTPWVVGGVPPYSYNWSTGWQDSVLQNIPAGAYGLTVTDSNGCEKTASYTLEETSYLSAFADTICEGDVYVFGGQEWMTDTTVCYNFTSFEGCDSLVCLELVVLDTFMQSLNVEICSGDAYEFYGQWYAEDTLVCQSFLAQTACDSLICLNLSVVDQITSLTDTICPGESYFFNGQWLSQPGLYMDTLSGASACDSLLLLQLNVSPEQSVVLNVEGALCDGRPVLLNAAGDFVSYTWSNGSTAQSTQVYESGVYVVEVEDDRGCSFEDSIWIPEVQLEVLASYENPSCFAYSNGFVRIDSVAGGEEPYLYALTGEAFSTISLFDHLPEGLYVVLIEDANVCRDTFFFELHWPEKLEVDAGEDLMLQLGESVDVSVYTNYTPVEISWQPSAGVFCDTCLDATLAPYESTLYRIEVQNADGCTASDELYIEVQQGKLIYIPNAFSPNGDGINDHFEIFPSPAVKRIRTFTVFDRWGNQLFSASSDSASSLSWDGRSANGQPLPEGIYTWLVEAELLNGQTLLKKGELVLIR